MTDNFASFSLDLAENWAAGTLADWDSSTGSVANMGLAKEWYRRCLRDHPQCHKSPTPLPTRLIDLGEMGGGSEPVLYETPPGMTGEYVILSHCWGGGQPLEPIGPLIDRRWPLPPLSKWLRTFQDAVYIAKRFNIRYVWIDSPCILQRNEQDWITESGRMSAYFSNAAFTIAAMGAEDGTQGCFWPRNPVLTRPCCVKLHSGCKTDSRPELFFIAARPRYDSDPFTNDAPLHSRVWVLQEELLSRRILRFGKRQMYWDCLTLAASESDPEEGWKSQMTDTRRILHSSPIVERAGQHRNPYYDKWYELVNKVSERNITFNRDILPAISAIAESIHRLMDPGDKYLAGLWEKDLVVGLLWVVPRGECLRPKVPEGQPNYDRRDFFAPSWSWISMSDREPSVWLRSKIMPGEKLNLYNPRYESWGTQILSANVELRDDVNIYGEVKSGTLRFRAQICPVRIERKLSPRHDLRGNCETFSSSGLTWNLSTVSIPRLPRLRFRDDEGASRIVTGDCELDRVEETARWWSFLSPRTSDHFIQAMFLPLLVHDDDNPNSFNRFMGLALVPTENENEFKRIGRASLNVDACDFCNSGLAYQEITVV